MKIWYRFMAIAVGFTWFRGQNNPVNTSCEAAISISPTDIEW